MTAYAKNIYRVFNLRGFEQMKKNPKWLEYMAERDEERKKNEDYYAKNKKVKQNKDS